MHASIIPFSFFKLSGSGSSLIVILFSSIHIFREYSHVCVWFVIKCVIFFCSGLLCIQACSCSLSIAPFIIISISPFCCKHCASNTSLCVCTMSQMSFSPSPPALSWLCIIDVCMCFGILYFVLIVLFISFAISLVCCFVIFA